MRFLGALPLLFFTTLSAQTPRIPGAVTAPWFDEQVRLSTPDDRVRLALNAPAPKEWKGRPLRLVVFATPNGNTIEQTLGCARAPKRDWHYDIQHLAAQIRALRRVKKDETLVLATVQARELSWPSWRAKRNGGAARVRKIVDDLLAELPGTTKRVTLCCHSGGGSFLWGFLDSATVVHPAVDRIVFLDANYSYDDRKKHGDKFLAWLKASSKHHLVVIAYDDREITYQGKKVVGPTGGTWRACDRMMKRFAQELKFSHRQDGDLEHHRALQGRITITRHRNPKNRILHTALVGDMNGILHALTLGTPAAKRWGGRFGGARAYTAFVQPEPGIGCEGREEEMDRSPIPERSPTFPGGEKVFESLKGQSRDAQRAGLLRELLRGNVPPFLWRFVPVAFRAKDAKGKAHAVRIFVTPDYLSIGSDEDFVRTPLTPQAAQRVADRFDASLPTRALVDRIHANARRIIAPHPLTREREALLTFLQHDGHIDAALKKAGAARGDLVAGIKKDLVLTPKLLGFGHKVAIYGWHHPDGKPIQPLYTRHAAHYVDYSHGVRLISKRIEVDGKAREFDAVLSDALLHPLLSDEGPLGAAERRYPLTRPAR